MTVERKVPLVLVVDDEDVIRELLRRRLTAEGYRIETAEDGEEAVAIINRGEFVNLVVTDVKMPGLDGMEVLKRARAKSADTQVIIMTAYASTETAIEAVRQGAYDYIQKPFDHVDDVANKVRRALREQALELQNREMLRKLEEMNKGLKQMMISRTKELNDAQDALRQTLQQVRAALRARLAALGELPAQLRRSLGEIERIAAGLSGEPAEALKREAAACGELLARIEDPLPVQAGDDES